MFYSTVLSSASQKIQLFLNFYTHCIYTQLTMSECNWDESFYKVTGNGFLQP